MASRRGHALLLIVCWAALPDALFSIPNPYMVRNKHPNGTSNDITCDHFAPNESCYNQTLVEPFHLYNISEVHRRLEQEKGLRTLIRTMESLAYPEGRPNRTCRWANETQPQPLCLTPTDLAVPNIWASFQQFMEGKLLFSFPCNANPYYPACPYLDGLGFRSLADYIFETISYIFGTKLNKRFNFKNAANRSLVYWNLGLYSGPSGIDLMTLRQTLPTVKQHFFLLHHNTDNPRFPPWLLDSPKVLKIFAAYVPEGVRHPKIIPLPLGLSPMGRKVALNLERARANFTNHTPKGLLAMSGFTLGKRAQGKALNRRANRRHWLGLLAPRFKVREKETHRTNYKAEEYYLLMRQHRFVLSLPGTGIDAFRTWEALYTGRAPVVSHWLHPLLFHELPVVRVQLEDVSPPLLEGEWKRLADRTRRFNLGRLWMPWWVARILQECLMTP
eukprot:GGOE01037443.1.p1 GENE.GGOE01037443.1~~GGOE01037443.1.p1  ORF type:complete len:445 (-),score=107.38 GGOE01037443.1:135-1469(-)